MTPAEAARALRALAGGAGALVASTMLLQRVLRPTLETRQYAHDIQRGTEAMRGNLEALAALSATRERAAALRREVEQLAVRS